jgi:alkylation response protein AidB-like acyl-CoA dehydrogenase
LSVSEAVSTVLLPVGDGRRPIEQRAAATCQRGASAGLDDPAMTTTSAPSIARTSSNGRSSAPELPGQLEPRTEQGCRLVALVRQCTPAIAARAAQADRDASFPRESLAELREAGVLRAPVPAELGGLGVGSVPDLVVAASRLARADASLAIGVNMHLVLVEAAVRSWRRLVDAGDAGRADRVADTLRLLAASGVAVAAAVSEPGPQDLTRPSTTATRTEAGWRIDGVKAFCTMSPAADLLSVAVSYTDDAGRARYGFALVPTVAEGVTVHDDWDALGMRGSGSGRVTLAGVRLGRDEITDSHPAGVPSAAGLDRYLTSGLFHAAATLGVAEAAHGHIVTASVQRRERLAAGGRSRQLVAANVVDLAGMRATLARAAHAAGAHLAATTSDDEDAALAEAAAVFAVVQSAKALVDRCGVQVVDRALELSGGAGYLSASPLARAYRDVRAGGFMHPLGANRAYDLIGAVELGMVPDLR